MPPLPQLPPTRGIQRSVIRHGYRISRIKLSPLALICVIKKTVRSIAYAR